jgi:hypothetical protein
MIPEIHAHHGAEMDHGYYTAITVDWKEIHRVYGEGNEEKAKLFALELEYIYRKYDSGSTITIEPELLKKVENACALRKESVNEFVEQAVRVYVNLIQKYIVP